MGEWGSGQAALGASLGASCYSILHKRPAAAGAVRVQEGHGGAEARHTRSHGGNGPKETSEA